MQPRLPEQASLRLLSEGHCAERPFFSLRSVRVWMTNHALIDSVFHILTLMMALSFSVNTGRGQIQGQRSIHCQPSYETLSDGGKEVGLACWIENAELDLSSLSLSSMDNVPWSHPAVRLRRRREGMDH